MILVGPSGCGKSTALRMIAGLEDITDGELKIGDRVVNDKAPKDRDIAMVFQNYALYPHMTVRDNMGFALKIAGEDKATINQKVEEAADASSTCPATSTASRRTSPAASASASRWAARSCAARSAFLMDEPLSNLDAKLRVQMRTRGLAHPAAAGRHHGLRDPRPDRGHDARRSRRGHAGGPAPAGRLAEGALQQPAQHLRRRLHRVAVDELLHRARRGRQGAACRSARSTCRRACRPGARSSRASAPRTSRTRR